ncbi:response regulator [Jeotgalibacillus sp. ET6]|uniref:response regulator n=1 Tax=Jeotgalibacillus sp. ET6 TaxID=3037260 RepID=UPI00241897D1|nr:response regulator [Jeotgalibacillus sp. ET6]MDG5472555.1 response regulator [Jeotgalibacillus sp. ET6]
MNKTILIIDDDEDIRFTFLEICTFAGWKGIEAPDGKSGIILFTAHQPDLVLVDYHMPEMDGLTTVKELRKLNQDVPILALTVDERQTIADSIIANGANDFILKPIRAPDLISRMNLHFRSSSLSDQSKEELISFFSDLPEKGLSKKTMTKILSYIKKMNEAETIKDISSATGISYPTVHRYVQYLVEKDLLAHELDYGKVGRPTHKYRYTNRTTK